jgi:ferric-dicitrate binding protein FerR (iron transport regulator)
MTDLQTLLEAACNGDLSPEQAAQLEAILRADPEARAMYLRYLALDAELALQFGHTGVEARMTQPGTITLTAPPASGEPTLSRRLPSILLRQPRGRFLESAAVVGVILALGAICAIAALVLQDRRWGNSSSGKPSEGLIATLDEFQGVVKIGEGKFDEGPAVVGMQLNGREVRVGPGSSAVLRYPDGTQLRLSLNSDVTVQTATWRPLEDGDKWVLFERGELDVEAKGGSPGHELVVHTAGKMVLRTADARFIVTEAPGGYYVEVTQGELEVKALPHLQPETVKAGACVEVTYKPVPEIRAVDPRPRRRP